MSSHLITNGKWYIDFHNQTSTEFIKIVSTTQVLISTKIVFLYYEYGADIETILARKTLPERVHYQEYNFDRHHYITSIRPRLLQFFHHEVNEKMSNFLNGLNFSGDLTYINR